VVKEIKISVIEFDIYSVEGYKGPANYYFVNAICQRVYIHTRDRKVAQGWLTKNYGKKYVLRTESFDVPKGDVTCKASTNSASRRGNNFQKIKNNYSKE
jgi:hypothetical protein